MALFKMSTPQTNGFSEVCPTDASNGLTLGLPPTGGTEVWTWHPGDTDGPVSFDIPPGDFIFAVHYTNLTSFRQGDRSGVSLCICGN
jgi:hypothetical protein